MEHGHDKHSAVEASSIPEENSSLGIGGGGKIVWKLEKGLKWMGMMRKSRKRNESEPLVGPGFAVRNEQVASQVGQRNKTTGLVSLYDARERTEYNAGKRRTTSRRQIVKSNDVIGELWRKKFA
ncbi:Uncharacterized protein TSPI_00445 [Trichinella spiralis]|uniref:Uncharacterized protein n=1 Tax=Trichinella spiralis TaxID=6334 RepID=A0ABR3KX12_TRISP|nr:general transcription factor 3C polypeptide 2 [Trichinella spiralis]